MNAALKPFARQRGLSLIEALVALAVMAIGMLGLVGVQTSLRGNSDLAKQRSEAVRIAQQKIEYWRSYSTTDTGAVGELRWNQLIDETADVTGMNATYHVVSDFTSLPAPRNGRTLDVQVTWTDRAGQSQGIDFQTLIAGAPPELAGTLVVPGQGDTIRRPVGRIRGTPIVAKDLGNGTSGLMPTSTSGSVVWVFNNATGVFKICTTSASSTDLLDLTNISGCGTQLYSLLSGFVRYATSFSGPLLSDLDHGPNTSLTVSVNVTAPTGVGTVTCLLQPHFADSDDPERYTAYYCAIPVVSLTSTTTSAWSGKVVFGPSGLISGTLADNDSSNRKMCRYHSHATYSLVRTPLANENYVMIRAGNGGSAFSCPTGVFTYQPDT